MSSEGRAGRCGLRRFGGFGDAFEAFHVRIALEKFAHFSMVRCTNAAFRAFVDRFFALPSTIFDRMRACSSVVVASSSMLSAMRYEPRFCWCSLSRAKPMLAMARAFPSVDVDARAGDGGKKRAKLLTQKKCVASFRRNASHFMTSDQNEPPSVSR